MRWVGLFLVLCLVLGGFVGVPVVEAYGGLCTSMPTACSYGRSGGTWYVALYYKESGCLPGNTVDTVYGLTIGGISMSPYQYGCMANVCNSVYSAWGIDGQCTSDLFDGEQRTIVIDMETTCAGKVYQWQWSGYVTFPEKTSDGSWTGGSSLFMDEPPPLAVEISCGANFGELGETMTFYADVTGGWTPYAVQFLTVFNGVTTYMDVQNGSGSEYTEDITFTKYGQWTVGVKVVDGESVPASDYMYVTIGVMKPDLNGVVRVDGNGDLEFGVSKSEIGTGWEWGFGLFVNTGSYVVLSPGSKGKFPDHYILNAVVPFDNPLVVQIEYTEAASGESWVYQFSFDMTGIETEGEWTDSAGNDNVATMPDWLRPFFDWLRKLLLDVFNWLFVPTASQIDDLLPSGSLGASLLDGVAWTGAEAGEYTLHGHWTVNGSEVEVPLVSFNVSSVAASPFVGVVRKIVQAGVCLALVYMVVVLV